MKKESKRGEEGKGEEEEEEEEEKHRSRKRWVGAGEK